MVYRPAKVTNILVPNSALNGYKLLGFLKEPVVRSLEVISAFPLAFAFTFTSLSYRRKGLLVDSIDKL